MVDLGISLPAQAVHDRKLYKKDDNPHLKLTLNHHTPRAPIFQTYLSLHQAMKPPAVRRFLRTCKLCLEDVGFGSSGLSRVGGNHSHGSMVSVVFESFSKNIQVFTILCFGWGKGVGEQLSEKQSFNDQWIFTQHRTAFLLLNANGFESWILELHDFSRQQFSFLAAIVD